MESFPRLTPLPDVTEFDDGMGKGSYDDRPIRRPKYRQQSVALLANTEIREITNLIGDRPGDVRTAKRLLGLKQVYQSASLPELYVMDYLNRKGKQYWFQQYAFGGRNVKGGFVADFTVLQGKGGMVLNVNGDYWHSKRNGRDKDYASRIALTGSTVNGVRILHYVEVWESDLYKMKTRVLDLALANIEVRGLTR